MRSFPQNRGFDRHDSMETRNVTGHRHRLNRYRVTKEENHHPRVSFEKNQRARTKPRPRCTDWLASLPGFSFIRPCITTEKTSFHTPSSPSHHTSQASNASFRNRFIRMSPRIPETLASRVVPASRPAYISSPPFFLPALLLSFSLLRYSIPFWDRVSCMCSNDTWWILKNSRYDFQIGDDYFTDSEVTGSLFWNADRDDLYIYPNISLVLI